MSVNDLLIHVGATKEPPKLDVFEEAAKRGTRLHKLIAADTIGDAYDSYDIPPEDGCILGAAKLWREDEAWDLVGDIHVEKIVYDLDLGLAGTADFMCVNEMCGIVADMKTSKKASRHHQLQVAAYVLLASRMGLCPRDAQRRVVLLRPDGTYKIAGPAKCYDSDYELQVCESALGVREPEILDEWVNRYKKM